MTDPDLIGLFVEPLDRLGLTYMVTGGVASVIYGDPRFTRDVDLVLELTRADIRGLVSEFSGGDFYLPPDEVLEVEADRMRGGHFNIIHRETGLRADVYVAGDDPLHEWAFDGRRRVHTGSSEIWVAPAEYVVVRKLEYLKASGSDRHLRDVAAILRISGERLDLPAVERWAARLELAAELAQAHAHRPPEV